MPGWIKLYRELRHKAIWKCCTPQQKTILITLLLMVNWEEKQWIWKGKKFSCQPGQLVTSLDSIVKEAGKGISVRNVRTALKLFEKYEFLTNEATKTGRLININNWDSYQGSINESDKATDKEVTKTRQRSDKEVTPTKEVKNVKNEKKKTLYGEFILLTEEEYERILRDFGQNNLKMMIEKLDNYFGADKKRLKKYTSHNHVLRGWVAEKVGVKNTHPLDGIVSAVTKKNIESFNKWEPPDEG